jgi:alkyldihydroxyacetonephosphate synthase
VEAARALKGAFPELTVSDTLPDRVAYARDLWPRRLLDVRAGNVAEHSPLAIAWPRRTEDVVELVRFARNEGFALVPFGAGSGVCGGVQPNDRTIVVDLKRFGDWKIDASTPHIDVGAGAMGITLEEDIQRDGFTIGHFPSSILCSTVGGWIAARGAGQCSGLYGKIEDMVVSLECVLGTGEVATLRRRFDGPNLVPLMIGSEGTLGIVTSAKLRLHPVAESRAFAAFSFRDIQAGWDTMRRLFQVGLRPSVSRLYDPLDSVIMKQGKVRSEKKRAGPGRKSSSGRLASVLRGVLKVPRALNAAIEAMEGNLLGGCTLVLVFEGQADEAHADVERATEICQRAGARVLGEGPARKWYAHRYGVSYRQAPVFRMGAFSDTMEVAAPWSKLAGLYDAVRSALGKHVLVMAHLSHAYPDGCSIYFTFSGAADSDEAATTLYETAWRDALDAAIDAGGTLSHHHGVGRSKAPRLGDELGHGVTVVRRLMRSWDPERVLNPGNLLPRSEDPPPETRELAPFFPGEIDDHSLLATVLGTTTVVEVERALGVRGLTLDLEGAPDSRSVNDWIASGLPQRRDAWSDPVEQNIAGLSARMSSGERLLVRPAPRRAVGPDLVCLFAGAGGEVGHVEHATLRVHRKSEKRSRNLAFGAERNPGMDAPERAAWQRIVQGVKQDG